MTGGLRLHFRSPPPLSLLPPPRAIPNPSQLPAIRSFLPGLLSRRIIRKIYFPRLLFFSRLFLVGKKGGSLRLVIDLSLLNQFLFIPSFHMESVPLIASGIVDPLWGCTLDLEDAYYHVPVNWFFQMFLAFVIDGQVYVFQYLPFGLSTAPWAFNRVMKPIKSHLHQLAFRVHSFLDDFLFLHSRRDGLEDLTEYALSLFRKLGFRINLKKSFLSPSQTIEYLGVIFHLDSLTLSLPQAKIRSITSLCLDTLALSHRSRRQLESLIGLLNFASSLVPLGRLRLRPLISWMNSHSVPSSRDLPVPLLPPFKSLLEIWSNPTFLSTPVPMTVPTPTIQLMTDASLSGWSGVILPYTVSGTWPLDYSSQSINWLELMAIFFLSPTFFHSSEARVSWSCRTTQQPWPVCSIRAPSGQIPSCLSLNPSWSSVSSTPLLLSPSTFAAP
ncbi:unnamed protein product [Meganyctiphanes norvegica]|uniref:Reverse transcriptase domain-containing protein n=1 Tax=Meganyctiphanes norvegica TaxID=48144 RepID=A0AAV2QQ62_MEGNR